MAKAPNFDTEFRQFAEDSSNDELSAALLVNLLLDPTLDRNALRARLDALADTCPEGLAPWTFLHQHGFRGVPDGALSLAHSRMADVLRTGCGIPISLGVLLVHVARHQGLQAKGINFPGHFLTRMDQLLVDPLTFQPVSKEDCLKRLSKELVIDPFAEASSTAIALRMLNNVKVRLSRNNHWDRILNVLDHQLILQPNSAELLYERGQAWEMLGAPGAARQSYALVAESALDPKLRKAAKRRMDDGDDDTIWH